MDPICDCQAPCHSLGRGKDRWEKTAERNMLGLWLLGFSNSLCYFITAQQFICAIAMVCQTPFTKSQCITRSWFPFITSKLLAPPLLSCSLALGVLLGGIGDGETCEENCVSNWSPLILLSWAVADSLSLRIYSTQRLRSHNPGRAFCKQGKTYSVAAIASTSRPSPNPSRRVCTGVVSSGPWTWFGKSSCCALCVQLYLHESPSIKLFQSPISPKGDLFKSP